MEPPVKELPVTPNKGGRPRKKFSVRDLLDGVAPPLETNAQGSQIVELNARFERGELSEEEFSRALVSVKPAPVLPVPKPETKKPPRAYNRRKPVNEIARPKKNARLKVYPITRENILQAGMGIQDPHDRALFFTLYLSGARISEIVGQEDEFNPDGTIKKRGCPPLLKSDVVYRPGQEIAFNVQTLKRKDRLPRIPPAPDREPYRLMIQEVMRWVEAKNEYDVLFNITRQNARRRFAKIKVTAKPIGSSQSAVEKRLHPHYLRHCRLTHLAVHHHLADSQIRTFTGWTSSALAAQYVDLDKERQTLAQSNEDYQPPV